jgi:hypothetical protein
VAATGAVTGVDAIGLAVDAITDVVATGLAACAVTGVAATDLMAGVAINSSPSGEVTCSNDLCVSASLDAGIGSAGIVVATGNETEAALETTRFST